MIPYRYFFILIFAFSQLNNLLLYSECFEYRDGEESNLLQDLMIVDYWNQRMVEKFPVTYNHLLQGGYFSMPSARMGEEGEFAAGYGYIHPYIHYNLKFQLVNFLEVTGSYRIFKGVDDPVLTPLGFGDFSDKGANIKLSIFSPEDSRYRLPGFAVGMEDFMGTKSFNAYYIVLTQVFLKQNFEVSIGYGTKRIHGWFGGLSWMPFRKSKWDFLRGLSLVMEYDAIPYEDEFWEKHPKGRIKKTPLQLGLKYRLWDSFDFSLAYIRGDKLAFTVSTFYNFGSCKGFLPKIHDSLPYRSPVNNQPIGCLRPEDVMIQEFVYVMREQGFDVSTAWLSNENGCKRLRIFITNLIYRNETALRCRLESLLPALAPCNVDEIIIVLDVISMPVQEIRYKTVYLNQYREQEIGKYELQLLTPWQEVSEINSYDSILIFRKRPEWWNLEVLPKTNTIFGSSKGKFKYALGLSLNLNGFILDNVYYSMSFGYFFTTNIRELSDKDRLNPSQLINVRTDLVNYFKCGALTLDEAYLEKVSNWGKGWYTRISLGIFEVEYGGVSSEWLYYPVNSNWAIGMDFAVVKKRTYDGWGFTNKIRKLDGFTPHYLNFLGSQYFLNLYYDWKATNLEFKVSVGKFLADDFGARTEVSRYFFSGLRVGFWYTYTNGNDIINNQTYHDTGVFFSVPLDIFYTKTSRSRWGYGMSAWLRDVGATAYTGTRLYELINQERQ